MRPPRSFPKSLCSAVLHYVLFVVFFFRLLIMVASMRLWIFRVLVVQRGDMISMAGGVLLIYLFKTIFQRKCCRKK
jgi:hypothetical protein